MANNDKERDSLRKRFGRHRSASDRIRDTDRPRRPSLWSRLVGATSSRADLFAFANAADQALAQELNGLDEGARARTGRRCASANGRAPTYAVSPPRRALSPAPGHHTAAEAAIERMMQLSSVAAEETFDNPLFVDVDGAASRVRCATYCTRTRVHGSNGRK